MTEPWTETAGSDVSVGDRVRVASGTELTVSRIDGPPFLGSEDRVCLVEDTDERWLAQPIRLVDVVLVQRA